MSNKKTEMPESKLNAHAIRKRMMEAIEATTYKKIAEYLGLGPQAATMWTAPDRMEIPLKHIQKISDDKNINLDWLLYGREPKYKKYDASMPDQTDRRKGKRIIDDKAFKMYPFIQIIVDQINAYTKENYQSDCLIAAIRATLDAAEIQNAKK